MKALLKSVGIVAILMIAFMWRAGLPTGSPGPNNVALADNASAKVAGTAAFTLLYPSWQVQDFLVVKIARSELHDLVLVSMPDGKWYRLK